MNQPARFSPLRLIVTLALCLAGWAVVAAASLTAGSSRGIGWPTPWQMRVRGEVVLNASLIGAALGAAGATYQALLRNSLADPYLLGASTGASLAAYLWRLPFIWGVLRLFPAASALSQQAFAFAGAIASIAVVFALAGARGRLEPLTLLLVGVIVNAVNGSIFLFVDALHKNLPSGSGPLTFLVGEIQSNLTVEQFRTAAVLIFLAFVCLLYLSGELNIALLADAEARALGVRLQRLRWMALIAASMMTAAAVAISGPIGFIGLICPHAARRLVGYDQRMLLPASAAIGAALLALADAVSRGLVGTGLMDTQLPVGVLTGMLGGPFFLLLLWRGRHIAQG